ncbi:MAG TPA: EutN/CcmL family microcompartment protein [Streptosporangiaceae bacterium]
MLQGTVVGNVWSTKRIDGLPNGAFLEVEVAGSGDRLVAFDVLGTGPGERVLIAQGSVASGWLPDRPPVDALIIGSIDEPSAPPRPAAPAKKSGRARTSR